MKKKLFVAVITLTVCSILVCGCVTTPKSQSAVISTVQEENPPYRIIDSRTMALGGSIPRWVEASMESRAKIRDLYPNNAVFQLERSGSNLDALKFWLDTFDVNTELSQTLSTYIKNTAGATTSVADATRMNQAAESFSAVATKSTFSGLGKEADFWVLKQYADGKKEYTYYVLYTMPKTLYDKQLDDILNQMPITDKTAIQPLVEKAKQEIGRAY